jgi:hypothetical protein
MRMADSEDQEKREGRPAPIERRFEQLRQRMEVFGDMSDALEGCYARLREAATAPLQVAKKLRAIRRVEAEPVRTAMETERERSEQRAQKFLDGAEELRQRERRAVDAVDALRNASREILQAKKNQPELEMAARETAEEQRKRLTDVRKWLEEKTQRWRPRERSMPKDKDLADVVDVLPDLEAEQEESQDESVEGEGSSPGNREGEEL